VSTCALHRPTPPFPPPPLVVKLPNFNSFLKPRVRIRHPSVPRSPPFPSNIMRFLKCFQISEAAMCPFMASLEFSMLTLFIQPPIDCYEGQHRCLLLIKRWCAHAASQSLGPPYSWCRAGLSFLFCSDVQTRNLFLSRGYSQRGVPDPPFLLFFPKVKRIRWLSAELCIG